MIFRIIDINPSTYYHRIANQDRIRKQGGGRPIPGYSLDIDGNKVCDGKIKEYIIHFIEGEGFAYGYYKLHILLKRRYYLVINHKKVYRLCDEMGVLKPQRRTRVKYPKRIARNREITGSNQLWETDLKYGYIAGEDRFFYILSFLDVFGRNIIDYYIGLNCTGQDAAFTLENAMRRRNIDPKSNGLVIRSDNGPQFISQAFEEACIDLKVEHERIPTNTPNKNAHIEAFHRLLEEDCLSRNEFVSYPHSYETVVDYMDYYSNVRIHSALGYLSPADYYLAVLAGEIKPTVIKV